MSAVHDWVWSLTLVALSAFALATAFWVVVDALVKWSQRGGR